MALFAERGYHGTAMDEIARRSGVTPPVVYDHFESKVALHRRLLERTSDELLAMWRANLGGGGTVQEQVAQAFGAWASYVQSHPYAARMYFRETTGVEELRALHAEVTAGGRGALAQILAALSGSEVTPAITMTSEVIRGGLTELAIWWADHPDVPREAIVDVAMRTVWFGLANER